MGCKPMPQFEAGSARGIEQGQDALATWNGFSHSLIFLF
jgi:hypothetical protein